MNSFTMAQESLAQFQQLVLADEALQTRLWQTNARADFITLVVRLGVERGYDFTAAEVAAALIAGRRAWLEVWV